MNLPEGFTLEQQKPSLPEGFKLEEPKQAVNLPEGFKLEKQPDSLGRYIAEPAQENKTSNPFMGLVARASSLAGEGV